MKHRIYLSLLQLALSGLTTAAAVAGQPDTASSEFGLKRDSIYMDVLRRGRVAVGYLSYFPTSSAVNQTIGNNASQIARLNAFFEVNMEDSIIYFDRAQLLGTASIEGQLYHNEQLSKKRAEYLRKYLDTHYRLSQRLPVDVRWIGEDWEGLEKCVEGATLRELPRREEVLNIIRNVPIEEGREAQLMALDGGRPYRYMKQHFFPQQRRAVITLIYDMKKSFEKRLGHPLTESFVDSIVAGALLQPHQAAEFLHDRHIYSMPVNMPAPTGSGWYVSAQGNETPEDLVRWEHDRIRSMLELALSALKKPVETLHPLPAPEPVPETKREEPTPTPIEREPEAVELSTPPAPVYLFTPRVVLKTNLLALAGISSKPVYRTPMPNLEVEYLFNRRWSVALAGLYEKFSHASGFDAWHLTAYTLEGRYRPLPLHHYGGLYVGLYGRVGDYNFRQSYPQNETSDGRYNRTGKYQEAGLSLGYTLPLSNHWVLEAGASAGYRFAHVKHYTHESSADNWYEYRTKKNGIHLTDLFLKIGYRFGTKRVKE
ncbi:MAG: DUF3575 domain-containing protein [Prevotellaceae bacterium]|jgi:hypothetical protein|nr:DUF3575 domain-containing protein [Prevotellaceae bacterium]